MRRLHAEGLGGRGRRAETRLDHGNDRAGDPHHARHGRLSGCGVQDILAGRRVHGLRMFLGQLERMETPRADGRFHQHLRVQPAVLDLHEAPAGGDRGHGLRAAPDRQGAEVDGAVRLQGEESADAGPERQQNGFRGLHLAAVSAVRGELFRALRVRRAVGLLGRRAGQEKGASARVHLPRHGHQRPAGLLRQVHGGAEGPGRRRPDLLRHGAGPREAGHPAGECPGGAVRGPDRRPVPRGRLPHALRYEQRVGEPVHGDADGALSADRRTVRRGEARRRTRHGRPAEGRFRRGDPRRRTARAGKRVVPGRRSGVQPGFPGVFRGLRRGGLHRIRAARSAGRQGYSQGNKPRNHQIPNTARAELCRNRGSRRNDLGTLERRLPSVRSRDRLFWLQARQGQTGGTL